jgi:imidazolonepropionase-like amidohydrolase
VLPNQTVLVQHGWITAVGPSTNIPVPAGAARIDGRGKYLMPGLADMHAHVGLQGDPIIMRDDASAEAWLSQYVIAGVTTIRSMDARLAAEVGTRVLQLRAKAAAGELVSPRIYASGQWRTFIKEDWHPRKRTSGEAEQLADIGPQIEAYKRAGYDFIKVYSWDTTVVFDSVAAAAKRVGLPIAGHVPGGVSVRQALAAGMQSIEHQYGYTPSWNDSRWPPRFEPRDTTAAGMAALAAATRRAGTWNCPTAFWRDSTRVRFVKALQDAGAGLLLGTDAPSSFAQLRVPAGVRHMVTDAGLTPYQALATATRNVAEYFGTLDSTGTVAVGKRADLVLLDRNPLEDIRNLGRHDGYYPAGVMLGGRWLPRAELGRFRARYDKAEKNE